MEVQISAGNTKKEKELEELTGLDVKSETRQCSCAPVRCGKGGGADIRTWIMVTLGTESAAASLLGERFLQEATEQAERSGIFE